MTADGGAALKQVVQGHFRRKFCERSCSCSQQPMHKLADWEAHCQCRHCAEAVPLPDLFWSPRCGFRDGRLRRPLFGCLLSKLLCALLVSLHLHQSLHGQHDLMSWSSSAIQCLSDPNQQAALPPLLNLCQALHTLMRLQLLCTEDKVPDAEAHEANVCESPAQQVLPSL